MNMNRFSIQHPNTRDYVSEWVFYKMLEINNLIALKYDFLNVFINNNNKGIYAIEQAIDFDILKQNNRINGVIIHFSEKNLMQNKFSKGEALTKGDKFFEADIIPFRAKAVFKDSKLKQQFYTAKLMLEDFRIGEKKVNDVFDLKQIATLFAISDIIGEPHCTLWRNIRFYYNSKSNKLEPIGYDANKLKVRKYPIYNEWNNNSLIWETKEWYDLFFKDPVFLEQYFTELKRLSKKKNLDSFFEKYSEELNNKLNIIYSDFPLYQFYKYTYYRNAEHYKAMFKNNNQTKVYVNNNQLLIKNTSYFPIKILSVINHKLKDTLQINVIVNGKLENKYLRTDTISLKEKLNLDVKIKNKQQIYSNLVVEYFTLGTNDTLYCKIKK